MLENVHEDGGYAVVIASRPYHNDPLVNHGLPKLFSERGIPVLTPDAVPGVCNVDLSNSRIDIVNNYHARMLSCAVVVASRPSSSSCRWAASAAATMRISPTRSRA